MSPTHSPTEWNVGDVSFAGRRGEMTRLRFSMWAHRLVCWGPTCRVGQNGGVAIHRVGISKWILPPSHPFLSTSKTKTRSTYPAPLKRSTESHLQSPISCSPAFLFESSLSFIGSSVPFAFGHQQTQRYTCHPNTPDVQDFVVWVIYSGWSLASS